MREENSLSPAGRGRKMVRGKGTPDQQTRLLRRFAPRNDRLKYNAVLEAFQLQGKFRKGAKNERRKINLICANQ
jgi:hypothetical protein